MNLKEWKESKGWYENNKNFHYWIKNILLYIFYPIRFGRVLCTACHTLSGDLARCKCGEAEREEEKRRIKVYNLDPDIHCVWCSTKKKKQKFIITKKENYYKVYCQKCKSVVYRSWKRLE